MKNSICFLGTGKINRRHIRIVKKLYPQARLAVASRDKARALSFKNEYDLKECFGDYQSAIHSDFTTIVIGVPPRYHHELVEEALSAGKHILIEKPIFNSLQEFKNLWPKLMRSNGIVMVSENHWFDPFHRKIKRCLLETDFGKPLFMDIVRLGVQKNKGWRIDPSEMPLGALHEGGVHWIRRLLDLANIYEKDPYNSIYGVTACTPQSPLGNVPYEDTMTVVARHKSGLMSRLFHSWSLPRRISLFDLSKVVLEKGTLYFDSRGLIAIAAGSRKKVILPSIRDHGGFRAMWCHFVECIEKNRKPALSLKDIFLDFSYLDAAYRSLNTHKEEVPEGIPSDY